MLVFVAESVVANPLSSLYFFDKTNNFARFLGIYSIRVL
jgi:hypothetical protein